MITCKTAYGVILALSLWLCTATATATVIELRAAYQDAFPKFYTTISAGETRMAGLCMDIMRAVEEKSPGIRFRRTNAFMSLQRIKGELAAGTIDVFFGLARTREREKLFQYLPTALYKITYVVAARTDDPAEVASYADLKSLANPTGGVMVLRGSKSEQLLRQNTDSDIILQREGKTLQNIRKLMAGRGRFVFYHDLGLKAEILREELEDEVQVLPYGFHETEHYVAFSRQVDPDTIESLGRILKSMSDSGELAAIYRRYVQ